MKILIVSWYFPPCSTMGALRVGKFAKYLVSEGHDIRIVCAKDQPYAMDHPVEVPAEIIRYSRGWDVNWLPVMVQKIRVWLKGRSADSGSGDSGQEPGGSPADAAPSSADASPGLLRRVLQFYQHITNIPDSAIGWLLPALRSARAVTRDWQPDVVFASAPPFTTLIAGRIIARRAGVPLVIEYRDRWLEDPYGDEMPRFRRCLECRIEEWCARRADAIVTVSEPWAEDYRGRWGKPVRVCYNGFDPEDVVAFAGVEPVKSDKLTILYTGIIYPERRDPTPLFRALALLGDDRLKISVDFYGPNVAQLKSMADETAQQDIVTLHDGVPFAEALALQHHADVLLLLQWNNPLEAGNVPGKLFEYLAARRPVIGIGYEDGVPARFLRERGAGRVLNDPSEIAAYLRILLDRKMQDGEIPLLPEGVKAGLSRPEQYGEIATLLRDVAAAAKSE